MESLVETKGIPIESRQWSSDGQRGDNQSSPLSLNQTVKSVSQMPAEILSGCRNVGYELCRVGNSCGKRKDSCLAKLCRRHNRYKHYNSKWVKELDTLLNRLNSSRCIFYPRE
jgi:hypothetical protein